MFCPKCGTSLLQESRFCGKCGAAIMAGPITRETEVFVNTSGRPCSPSELPPEARKLSWGAFWFSWIWGPFNGTPLTLLALVLPVVFNFVLLFKGRAWAWENKKWDTAADFDRVQKRWGMWGWIIGPATVVVLTIVLIAVLGR